MITWEQANTYKEPMLEIIEGKEFIVTTCIYCLHEVAIPKKEWDSNPLTRKRPMHTSCAMDKYL